MLEDPISGIERETQDLVGAWVSDARRRGLTDQHIAEVTVSLDSLVQHTGKGLLDQTPLDIRAWQETLATQGLKGRPVGAKSLNNRLSHARQFYGWARAALLAPVGYDPTAGIVQARVHRTQGRSLTLAEAQAIIEAAEADERSPRPYGRDARGRVIHRSTTYRLLLVTGIRIGAAQALRRRNFVLDAVPPYITVPAAADKSRTQRTIPISAADAAYFAPALQGLEPDDLAIKRPRAELLRRDAQRAGVSAEDANGRGIGFHCFRRAHASALDRLGVGARLIQQRLGHRRLDTTMGYLVRDTEEQGAVAEALARAIPATCNPVGCAVDLPSTGKAHPVPPAGRSAGDSPQPPAGGHGAEDQIGATGLEHDAGIPADRLGLLRDHLALMRRLAGIGDSDDRDDREPRTAYGR
jgi:integrase